MKTEQFTIPNTTFAVTFHIGKSQQENHGIIDMGQPDDLWFHLAGTSSSHVVALLSSAGAIDRKMRGAIIRRGALLCKMNTAKATSAKNIAVTYAKCKDITKGAVPGQVLIHGESHMITI
jgi:predicted ribosome quality control (RQC) complex YloA/Tae2 family protein